MDVSTKTRLLRRGLQLEYLTLGWNVVGAVVIFLTAFAARSVALAGFGLDSLIEIFASGVVVWQLTGTGANRDRRALRLIGAAFFALAIYVLVQSGYVLALGLRPKERNRQTRRVCRPGAPTGATMAHGSLASVEAPALGWVFVGLCAVFAFGGQLLTELHGGAGEHDISLDPRHAALLIATIAIAVLGWRGLCALRSQSEGDRDFHRLLKQSLSELPFRGRGAGFFLTVAATTFGMGLLAHVGERGSSALHDAIGWFAVALFVAVVAAIAARFMVRVLPDLVAAILAFFIAIEPRRSASLVHEHVPVFTRRECWSPPFLSRPPPLQA